ncbi:hypothetical protein GTA08_BOTSDO07054 [Botryosphaeria dothidea]|uniref:Uncharacterized protein n=1 Tax=Botryosphaeria dothidea TaxID=55169 RepID=A0A8H4IPM3_9PEZI|nr:hypothetical protein GTA08_BOTSDO11248 [Botryosphaeria dothidea]KAF4304982.1 hypothetical protein GTA08_BOTSDO07054 [Botryosphaeria dothidea]
MGVDTQRPPLPAPTETSFADDSSFRADDLATDISRRTDRSHFSIPDDGSPVTITTKSKDKLGHGRQQSQTSLLIEYFEAGKTGDKVHSRPSVRVRVTPSTKHRRSRTTGHDHVEITQTDKDRKPSYTRRISLPSAKGGDPKLGDTSEVSYSSESNVSGMPPVEVEVLHNGSDMSRSELSQSRYVPAGSDISSMPPDSMVDGPPAIVPPTLTRRRSRSLDREEKVSEEDGGKLKAPSRRRSRSLSRERIMTQKIMEKLTKEQSESSKLKQRREKSLSREKLSDGKSSSRRKLSRSRREEALISGTESSLLASDISRRSGDTQSIRSGISTTSSINNPKLLATVEDAIKRLILPEINALKEHQHRDKFDRNRDSLYSASSRGEPKRSVSKSSSAPNVKVVLNRDDKDPGVVLSGDSVRSKRSRRPSRDSGSEMSYDRFGSESTVREDEKLHKKRSKDKRLKDAAVAGAIGAGLTAAALKHHDSEASLDKKERRKRRSKSRSRSASISESIGEESIKGSVPPLPMQSELHASELTRDSILSADTERPTSSRGATPIREVSRGTPRPVMSPAPSTPTRTPAALRRGPNSNSSLGGLSVSGSARSDRELSTREKATAALAAAGVGGVAAASLRSNSRTPTREFHQGDLSYEDRKENLTPQGPRSTRSVASISSAGRETSNKLTELSLNSAANSPSTNAARSRRRSDGMQSGRKSDVSDIDIVHDSELSYNDGTATPRREEEADRFFEHEHEENDALRSEIDEKRITLHTDDSIRTSDPLDYNRLTTYTDDSMDGQYRDRLAADQDIHEIGERPDYVATPAAVESAVASLVDPSTVSTSVNSSQRDSRLEPIQPEFLHMEEPHQSSGSNTVTGHPETSGERWAALRDQAKRIDQYDDYDDYDGYNGSPPQSEGGSYRSEEQIQMTHNAMPFGDPMPEIGHGLDNESDVTTNPSEIQGPARTPDRWPYEPTPPMSTNGIRVGEAALAGGAAGAAATAAAHLLRDDHRSPASQDRQYQPTIEEDYEDYGEPYPQHEENFPHQQMDPNSPGNWKDEGYISAAQPGYTPEPQLDNSRFFEDSGLPDMSGDLVDEDPFVAGGKPMHARNFSGNSHGMTSPLYDSATGKGLDNIQSKDIVALMDHLTVRDAQRNARDTEILVTLVRSAAEMRNSFEEMKRFIAEQDKMIMGNTDRDAEVVIQRLLQGPRPQPPSTTRLRGRSSEDVDDLPTKRKNVFKRALKGLSMKNSNELSRIEDMLMQLLDEVEGLKDNQTFGPRPSLQGSQGNSMTSYENLRAAGDPGYEPEGRANTASTPNQSGTFSNPSSRHLGRHSGYDGRRGSEHRISTVLEGDEELEEHETKVLDHQFENNERLLTPTEEVRRSDSLPQDITPPGQRGGFDGSPSQEASSKTKSKHKSNSSSIFGIPKISRWSKTTASTEKSNGKKGRPYSQASRSGSNVNLDYYDYELQEDDRIRSSTSLNGHQRARSFDQVRSPSPLVPDDEDMDGPKYQAHRNSLNLEHPQPRPGPTHRHQTHLESQAINFDDPHSPDFDQWGSAPSLALNRSRFGGNNGHMSPLSDGGYSNHSASEQVNGRQRDDGPLVPQMQQIPQQQRILPFGAKQMYSSPPGSGQLLSPLPPIEEVRYSLETDRHSLTPSPNPQTTMRSPGRKITGPRPMSSKSPRPLEHSETVIRRKPVGNQSPDLESYRDSLDSFDRDTF